MLQTAWGCRASAVVGHANLPGSWKAAPQSVATGGNGAVTIRVVAKLKCVEFWYRVMKTRGWRLVKHVAVEAWKQRER